MNQSYKETIWRQFGASIDMLENAIKLCPPEVWDTEKIRQEINDAPQWVSVAGSELK